MVEVGNPLRLPLSLLSLASSLDPRGALSTPVTRSLSAAKEHEHIVATRWRPSSLRLGKEQGGLAASLSVCPFEAAAPKPAMGTVTISRAVLSTRQTRSCMGS